MTYEHDDGDAEADRRYAASCRLDSTGNYPPDEHVGHVEFFHRAGDGTPGSEDQRESERAGGLPAIDHDWVETVERDAGPAAFGDDDSS